MPVLDTQLILNKLIFISRTKNCKYSYCYYIPNSAISKSPARIVVYAHGSPKLDSYEKIEEHMVNSELPGMLEYYDKHGYILLTIITPRNFGDFPDYKMNTQAFAPWTMDQNDFDKPKYEFYKRPDLVFVQVINKMLSDLKTTGIIAHPKVFMTGTSNGGMQTNRFTMMHSNLIEAVAFGGIGAFMYPVKELLCNNLTFPLGIYDLENIINTEFSLEAAKKIPHFVFVGEKDIEYKNDPTNFDDVLLPEQIEIIRKFMGANQVQRTEHFYNFIKDLGFKCKLKIYPNIGHEYSKHPYIREDVFSYFDNVF